MSSSPPPGIERLIEAGKKGLLSHEFLSKRPYAHQARILFFSVLDQEWPELKRNLFHKCWPLFQEACSPFVGLRAGAQPSWAFPVHANGDSFIIPGQLLNLRQLEVSEDFENLRREFIEWSDAGRGIRDEWFLESAFHTLRSVAPTSKSHDFDGSDQPWLYPFERTYPHRWPPPAPHVNAMSPSIVIKRARRDHLKIRSLRFLVPKSMSSDHARWTAARLSDPNLSWSVLVDRFPQLKRYNEGISEAKRRVRKFAAWIDLNLSGGE